MSECCRCLSVSSSPVVEGYPRFNCRHGVMFTVPGRFAQVRRAAIVKSYVAMNEKQEARKMETVLLPRSCFRTAQPVESHLSVWTTLIQRYGCLDAWVRCAQQTLNPSRTARQASIKSSLPFQSQSDICRPSCRSRIPARSCRRYLVRPCRYILRAPSPSSFVLINPPSLC